MKLTKHQQTSKKQLNELCEHYGFEPLRELLNLSGSTLGQYLAFDNPATLSDSKLRMITAEYRLSCQKS